MRLFIAIPLPEDIRYELSDFQDNELNVRWVSPDQMHLTLKFLGQVNSIQKKQVSKLLSEIWFDSFQIAIQGFGFFPEKGSPRVFWAGIQTETSALHDLQNKVEMAALDIGIPKDKHPYIPHITLGRMNDNSLKRTELIRADSEISSRKFTVDHFKLYQSILQPEGAIHKTLMVFRSKQIKD
jgi:RNA 2',3'-cyclic 3'-phosphodiesterase